MRRRPARAATSPDTVSKYDVKEAQLSRDALELAALEEERRLRVLRSLGAHAAVVALLDSLPVLSDATYETPADEHGSSDDEQTRRGRCPISRSELRELVELGCRALLSLHGTARQGALDALPPPSSPLMMLPHLSSMMRHAGCPEAVACIGASLQGNRALCGRAA